MIKSKNLTRQELAEAQNVSDLLYAWSCANYDPKVPAISAEMVGDCDEEL